MRLIELQIGKHPIGLYELFLSLTREPNDNIRMDRDIWNATPNLRNQVSILLLCIAALHSPQHLIIPCLNGDLDHLADLRKAGDCVEQLASHPVGVGRQEADALNPVDIVHRMQQICQIRAIWNILAVTIHYLTQEGDFWNTLQGQCANLGSYLSDLAAALNAAPEWNHTERAGV